MRRAPVLVVLALTAALVTPVAAGAASGTAVYKKGLVTAADLPAGWTASPADTEGDAATAKDIAKCVGKPVVKKKAVVHGPDIVDPSGTFMVASSITVYSSAAVAKKQFAVYQSAKYADCAQKHFETTPVGGAGGPLPTAVIVDEVDLDRYGDRAVGHGAQAEIPNADGTTVTVTSIQAAVLRGKAIARYEFNGQGDVFDQTTGEELLATVDKRLDKAKL
ncbi:MAG: hypothetical protein ACXW1M_08555 [Acidimicrobiia bacterium]